MNGKAKLFASALCISELTPPDLPSLHFQFAGSRL